ncbi:ATP:cob(I)alamin adenosyltransferase [Vulcanisaeta thermophila]|uniref:ATP:cob(I)alamin adenosyltransferase n=1 Tax=Vulcanisaeta thermophila TaxID=867917 RepID=UPI00085373A3|nr:ATP:cob(I)alamin adenosyltransferase [Vulcanisaeta thermophila]
MTNVFADCIKTDGLIKCPGDGGFSEVIVFGKHVRIRKDHPVIELMGSLDELEAWSEWALIRLNDRIFGVIAALTTAVNTYLATGDEAWLNNVRRVVLRSCNLDAKELGWFIPRDERTALLNILRVKAREAERVAVRLLSDESLPRDKVTNLITVLNQLNKYIAHMIYLSDEVKVLRSVRDKINLLINDAHSRKT